MDNTGNGDKLESAVYMCKKLQQVICVTKSKGISRITPFIVSIRRQCEEKKFITSNQFNVLTDYYDRFVK